MVFMVVMIVAALSTDAGAIFILQHPLLTCPRISLVSPTTRDKTIAGQTPKMRITASDPEGIKRESPVFWPAIAGRYSRGIRRFIAMLSDQSVAYIG